MLKSTLNLVKVHRVFPLFFFVFFVFFLCHRPLVSKTHIFFVLQQITFTFHHSLESILLNWIRLRVIINKMIKAAWQNLTQSYCFPCLRVRLTNYRWERLEELKAQFMKISSNWQNNPMILPYKLRKKKKNNSEPH